MHIPSTPEIMEAINLIKQMGLNDLKNQLNQLFKKEVNQQPIKEDHDSLFGYEVFVLFILLVILLPKSY